MRKKLWNHQIFEDYWINFMKSVTHMRLLVIALLSKWLEDKLLQEQVISGGYGYQYQKRQVLYHTQNSILYVLINMY